MVATVLIVEDEATILLLAESVIQHAGYETMTAGTLAEAEAILRSDRKIDLVFTDIELRDRKDGGVEVGQIAQQVRPETPIVYASGRPFTDGMKELLSGRNIFLPKPYTDELIIKAVASLLRDQN